MLSKIELRTEMTRKRDQLDSEFKQAYDEKVCNRLLSIIKEGKFSTIHAYLPLKSEINILPLINNLVENKVKVVCPKTLKNRKLEHLELIDTAKIREGLHGTTYPASGIEYDGLYDIILVPGLAFDKDHYRLGYGGGYYDSFLKQNQAAIQIGLAYPFQIHKTIPVEAHDAKLNEVLYFTAL